MNFAFDVWVGFRVEGFRAWVSIACCELLIRKVNVGFL